MPETLNCLSEAIFKADKVIVGGLPAYTLLTARGYSLGDTHIDHSCLDRAAGLIRAARNQACFSVQPTHRHGFPPVLHQCIILSRPLVSQRPTQHLRSTALHNMQTSNPQHPYAGLAVSRLADC